MFKMTAESALHDAAHRLDWTDLAQDRERWQVLVNAVMNLRVPSNVGNSLSI